MLSFVTVSLSVVLVTGCVMRGNRAPASAAQSVTVERGTVSTEVVESGKLEAVKTVEVKSRVGGRIARLLVDEGDFVTAGQLIAVIDPQETELQVRQTRANLRGAQAGVQRSEFEIRERRVTAQNAVDRARSQVRILEQELRIQPELTKNAIRSAEAQLRSAEQAFAQLRDVTQPNARVASETAVADAENQLAQAELEEKRQAELFERGFVAKRVLEQAQLNRKLAETRKQNAEAELAKLDDRQKLDRDQAQERVRQAREEVNRAQLNGIQDATKREQYRQALKALSDSEANLAGIAAQVAGRTQQSAQVDQISASLQDSERNLRETQIRAPISGVVTKRLVQVGELVSSLSSFSSGTPIFRIEDRSSMLVKLEINEVDVAQLTEGTPAKVRVDALPGEVFDGTVTKVAPTSVAAGASATGQTAVSGDPVVKYQVEVTLNRTDPKIKSGMSASCTMTVAERKDVLRVPFDYVGRSEDGKRFVMIAPADANAKGDAAKGTRKDVQPGLEGGGFVEILEGLSGGEKLVKPDFTGPDRRGMMEFSSGDGDGGGGEGN